MRIETLFEKFELLAGTPNAVKMVRELIVQLAADGKLVPQDPDEEHADHILARCKRITPRTKYFARAEESLAELGNHQSDVVDSIPPGWAWACNAYLGDTSPRNDVEDGTVVAFAPMTLIPTDYRLQPEFEERRWEEVKKGYTHFADGDIAVAKITPCFQNGKACAFSGLTNGVGAGTTELHVLRPHPNAVDPYFMLLVYRSPRFVRGGVETFSGTAGQQRVANDYFRYRPIALPPLAEQKRIVARVDELMALCDRLEAQQQDRDHAHAALTHAALSRFADSPTVENLEYLFHAAYCVEPRDLRAAIVSMAVVGKLGSQDPSDEPAERSLRAIRRERDAAIQARRIRAPRATPPVQDSESPLELPYGWSRVRLGDIVMELQTGPFGSTLHKEDYRIGGTPVVNPASYPNGKIVPIQSMAVDDVTVRRLSEWRLRSGDILVARRGEMGRCAVVTDLEDGWLCGTGSLILRMPRDLYAPYLAMLIGSPKAREYLGGASVGTTMRSLNHSILEKMPVPLPPLAEQRRIVAKVNDLMALVDRLEVDLGEARTTGEKLMDAVVAELTAEN